jgi:hypothetical protein
MFSYRIRSRPDLRKQTRRRRGVEQVARAALDHLRQCGARGVDVRHHVDFPNPPPVLVRDLFETRYASDARVRAEEVNGAEGFVGLCDQGYDVAFAGDVGLDGETVDLIRDCPRRVEIDV